MGSMMTIYPVTFVITFVSLPRAADRYSSSSIRRAMETM